MVSILTSTRTIINVSVRPQQSNVGDPIASSHLSLQLKTKMSPESYMEQQKFLDVATKSAYVSLNKLDQRHRYRAKVDLKSTLNFPFNFLSFLFKISSQFRFLQIFFITLKAFPLAPVTKGMVFFTTPAFSYEICSIVSPR